MKPVLICLAAAMMTVSAGVTSGCTETPTEPSLDQTVTALMEQGGIPGLSLSVIENGKVSTLSQYGVANAETAEPVAPDHIFQAASLSKPVMAYITMRLVDQGSIGFDTPLYDILPSERFADPDRAKQLTPRLVLSHQSGLPNWGGTPLEFQAEPGSGYGYSGEGYVYLQQVLSELTGLSLEALAQREVLEPLGMTKSYFLYPTDPAPRIVSPHNDAGDVLDVPGPVSNAAASLHTEAGDYARFMSAVMTGEGLSPESHTAMLEREVSVSREWGDREAPLSDTLGWALGWATMVEGDDTHLWHWGDNGTYRAFVMLNPEERDGAVYFANSSLGHSIGRDLMSAIGFDASPSFDWLDITAHDAPGYQTWRASVRAEADKRYADALALMTQAYEESGETHEGLKSQIDWYETHLAALEGPAQVIGLEDGKHLAGSYGPRHVRYDDGVLYYRREEGVERQLIQSREGTFLIEGITGFHFSFEQEETTPAAAIVGYYQGGDQDRNPRDPVD